MARKITSRERMLVAEMVRDCGFTDKKVRSRARAVLGKEEPWGRP